MERNPNDKLDPQTPGSSGGASGSSGMSGAGGYGAGAGGTAGGYGSTGAGYEKAGTGSAGTAGGTGGMTGSPATHEEKLSERAREKVGTAREKAQSGLSQAREKAGEFKNTLADKLDAGADRLRQRQGGEAYAGATAGTTGDGSVGMDTHGNMERVSGGLASGMHNTAEWLRENDLDSMKQTVEQQVRDHPGRTLAIALGLGYLIGKAFRR